MATLNQSVQDNFPMILNKTLGYEGSALDPSGPSKYGVLEKTYQNYLKQNGQPLRPITQISMPEVQNIYRQQYYQAPGLDKLPLRTSAVTFDYGVQSGQGTSIKALQKIVGATPDGKLGSKSYQAINNYIAQNGEDSLIENMLNTRRAHYARLTKSNPVQYPPGLQNRVNRVETDWLRPNYGIRNLKGQ